MDAQVAQDEDLKKQAVVLDPLAETAQQPEQAPDKEGEGDAEVMPQEDVSQQGEGPRFELLSLQDRDQFSQDRAVPVALDLEGAAESFLSIHYEAHFPELGKKVELDQTAQMDSDGQGDSQWAFLSELSGRCELTITVADAAGRKMQQQVKLDILSPGAKKDKELALEALPKQPEEQKKDEEEAEAELPEQLKAEQKQDLAA